MNTTVAQLVDLLEPYSYCPLECDGLARVFTTLLQERGIAHTVYTGSIMDQGNGNAIVHMWIEVSTDEGRWVIDYRARQWLGVNDAVPHGIFDQADYQALVYEGKPIALVSLNRPLFLLLTMPISQLLGSLSLSRPIVYTLGYRQLYAESILAFLTSRGFPILDIRQRAGSRYNPAYNRVMYPSLRVECFVVQI